MVFVVVYIQQTGIPRGKCNPHLIPVRALSGIGPGEGVEQHYVPVHEIGHVRHLCQWLVGWYSTDSQSVSG
jgi:hypothetical protein